MLKSRCCDSDVILQKINISNFSRTTKDYWQCLRCGKECDVIEQPEIKPTKSLESENYIVPKMFYLHLCNGDFNDESINVADVLEDADFELRTGHEYLIITDFKISIETFGKLTDILNEEKRRL